MTKTKVQKTINKITKDTYSKDVSIQFSLGGFSFCISNSITKEIQHFTTHTFEEPIATPELLLSKIEELFNDFKALKQDFDTLKFQLQVLQTQSELTNKFDQIITATIKNNAQDSIHLELILKQTLTKTRRGRKISPGTLNGTDSNLIILFVQNRLNTKHVLLEINNLKKSTHQGCH